MVHYLVSSETKILITSWITSFTYDGINFGRWHTVRFIITSEVEKLLPYLQSFKNVKIWFRGRYDVNGLVQERSNCINSLMWSVAMYSLTHCGLLTPCDKSLGQHIGQIMVCCLMTPTYYLHQCYRIVNQNLRNTIQWNLKRKYKDFFLQESAIANIVQKMAILFML